jgi:hypothetical protein
LLHCGGDLRACGTVHGGRKALKALIRRLTGEAEARKAAGKPEPAHEFERVDALFNLYNAVSPHPGQWGSFADGAVGKVGAETEARIICNIVVYRGYTSRISYSYLKCTYLMDRHIRQSVSQSSAIARTRAGSMYTFSASIHLVGVSMLKKAG